MIDEINSGAREVAIVHPYGTLAGIDVSEWQGVIDWGKVQDAGIDFAIIRCGWGNDLVEQDDQYWERNVSECERLGIPYGVYLYSYANTIEKANSEAMHALRLLEGHIPYYPVYYDMEDNRIIGSDYGQMASTFCSLLQNAGYDTGVYANLNWWTQYLTDPVFENWHRWVAQYNDTCDYTGRYGMWQYTSSGRVNGINGNVDRNWQVEIPGKTETFGRSNPWVYPGNYKDIHSYDWFAKEVYDLEMKKIMTGFSPELFAPYMWMTREQLAVILYRMEGKPDVFFQPVFSDVEEGQWYSDAIIWAYQNGIVTGYEATGTFGVSQFITREEIAAILYRYAKYKGETINENADLSSYPDADAIHEYALNAVKWAVEQKIIQGIDGRIAPLSYASRGEGAVMISRYMNLYS